jgi:hypothetical protein
MIYFSHDASACVFTGCSYLLVGFLLPSIQLMYNILPLTIIISDENHHVLIDFYKIFLTDKKKWCVLSSQTLYKKVIK